TPDELAALYLRARDVPCPGCGYNRRDGIAAACPECLHPLKVSHSVYELDPETGRIASAVSAGIACCGAVLCASVALIVLENRRIEFRETTAVLIMLGSICCAILAMNRAITARATRDLRFLRQFLILLSIGIMAFSLAMMMTLWNQLF
ncbi:MAG: hypothetical protein D6692_08290, partial [Planctomycetota bacterium]